MATNYPPDMRELSASIGYDWPDDEPSRIRVLVLIARQVVEWRKRAERAEAAGYVDRHYQHLLRRCQAMATKLRAVRRAAVEYKRGRDYQLFEREFLKKEGVTDER